MPDSDEHSSLLRQGINYGRQKLFSRGSRRDSIPVQSGFQISIGLSAVVSDKVAKYWKQKKRDQSTSDEEDDDGEEEDDAK